ncbi:beta family protein [Actinomadura roseirufa]|uniref:beta family protein n=1 Tax=Actinomadura roseirufa TaxID=2094049 RepID=UPI001041BB13|nr:beta family protein [Actinomadura roseirufa]
MTAYVPILKAKLGESDALRNLASPSVQMRPLLEVTPQEPKENDTADDAARKFTARLEKFARMLRDELPEDVVCAIDTALVDGAVPAQQVWQPILGVFTEVLISRPVRPVVRLTDSPQRLTQAREVVSQFQDGACLRLEPVTWDLAIREATAALDAVLTVLDQSPQHIDLVIDLWTIKDDTDVQHACTAALAWLAWADTNPWRSVAVASSAFPKDLTGVPLDAVTPLPRRDADLWRQVRHHWEGQPVDFGDYAIAHPALGQGFRGFPNLRYTTDSQWQVWRQRTPGGLGNRRFCIICQDVVASEYWTGEHCWGDAQIALRAQDSSNPGGPANWRAFGTSRHLAVVTDRLARFGEP